MSSPLVESEPRPTQAEWLQVPSIRSAWCVVAAFGTYACMYGFRKPFTAGTYPGIDGTQDLKVWLVAAQVIGYTISKFAGIRVIAEMRPQNRTRTLLGLIAFAEIALLGFALVPAPWNIACLFLNGLPLGMVFGLVLGFVVMLVRRLWTAEASFLQFFNTITLAGAAVGILAMAAALLAFRRLRSAR